MIRTFRVDLKSIAEGSTASCFVGSYSVTEALKKAKSACTFYQAQNNDPSWTIEAVCVMPLPVYWSSGIVWVPHHPCSLRRAFFFVLTPENKGYKIPLPHPLVATSKAMTLPSFPEKVLKASENLKLSDLLASPTFDHWILSALGNALRHADVESDDIGEDEKDEFLQFRVHKIVRGIPYEDRREHFAESGRLIRLMKGQHTFQAAPLQRPWCNLARFIRAFFFTRNENCRTL